MGMRWLATLWDDVGAYVPAVLTLAVAAFSLAKDWTGHKSSTRRLSVAVLIILLCSATIVQIRSSRQQSAKEKAALTNANQQLNNKIDNLNGQIQQGQQAAELSSKTFSDSIGHLTDRVADLQTKVQTADLRAEAATLLKELKNNQAAMAPAPKASLTVYIDNQRVEANTVSEQTIKVASVDGHIRFKLRFLNATDADALNGFNAIWICDNCILVKELPGWTHVDGAPPQQRNNVFESVLAQTEMPDYEFEILPPSFAKNVEFGFKSVCHTCASEPIQKVRLVFEIQRPK